MTTRCTDIRYSILVLAMILAVPNPSYAVDGVLEINQACAVNTGCIAGDSAGFPISITASGSYRLTSNLDVTGETTPQDVTAIDLNAHYVTIDLNGFSIIGPGTAGAGLGIDAAFLNGITVLNGTIQGMGNYGVKTDRRARIEGLHVANNGKDGISVDLFSIVKNNRAFSNDGTGISANESSIHGNSAHQNGDDGIDGNNGSSVWGNAASSNGGDGIEVRFGSTVRGNAMRLNNGAGLNVPQGSSGYTDNVIEGSPTVSGTGAVEIGVNFCGSNTTCP